MVDGAAVSAQVRAGAVVIRFTLPIRLVSEANAHAHWRERQRRAKAQRSAAYLSAYARVMRLGIDLPAIVTIARIGPRALDSDNLAGCAKHVRDGIADALGIKDNDPRVEWRVEQRRGKPREYAVEIVIEPKA